ncbi:SDR family oxidoreductase [Streptomyces sp. FXJ1.172]|uniref:SDR family NAD(P)-dependent oxidoreductase n=1 Tax=Streptomyces sp. FXJ1.172 TaxID=710705 RepID=UPI0007CFCD9C|nr:SDR family oxidoreductase [Streptomyces sp. FXJ1.172]WEO99084.1 SDR family oxidoreductase [Streptomyces sp. FXJ1.172]
MNGAKWAVVTGASSGIGEHLARGLAARGHDLWLVARGTEALERLAKELQERHRVTVRVRTCDLADPAARGALTEELAGEPVSVLCANAGFPTCGPFSTNDPAKETAEVQVNVVALHALTQALLPGMLARGHGRILVTGSTAGCQPVPTAATYAATKAFANSFAESLHVELRGTGVTCTLLAPGPVRTNFYLEGGIQDLQKHAFLAWLTPRRVAEAGLRGMAEGRRVVVPGPVAKAQYLAGRHTPRALLFPVLGAAVLPLFRRARGGTGGTIPNRQSVNSRKV